MEQDVCRRRMCIPHRREGSVFAVALTDNNGAMEQNTEGGCADFEREQSFWWSDDKKLRIFGCYTDHRRTLQVAPKLVVTSIYLCETASASSRIQDLDAARLSYKLTKVMSQHVMSLASTSTNAHCKLQQDIINVSQLSARHETV